MTWFKVNDQFFAHPKVIDLSKDAKLLYLAGLAYCHEHLTDGQISAAALRMVAATVDVPGGATVAALTDAGLWEAVAGGYHVHDYLDHQESAATTKRKRDEARERMRHARNENSDECSQDVRANKNGTAREVRTVEVEVDKELEEDVEGDERDVPLSAESGRAAPAATPPLNVPKPNRTQQVIDLLAADGVEVKPRPQDGKAIKDSGAKPEEIAACFLAIFRSEWGDDFMLRNLSLQSAVNHLDGYRAMLTKAQASPRPGGVQGQCPACGTWKPKGEPCARCARAAATLGNGMPTSNVAASLRAVSRRS